MLSAPPLIGVRKEREKTGQYDREIKDGSEREGSLRTR